MRRAAGRFRANPGTVLDSGCIAPIGQDDAANTAANGNGHGGAPFASLGRPSPRTANASPRKRHWGLPRAHPRQGRAPEGVTGGSVTSAAAPAPAPVSAAAGVAASRVDARVDGAERRVQAAETPEVVP